LFGRGGQLAGAGDLFAFPTNTLCMPKKSKRYLTETTLFSVFCASVLFVHQTNKMAEPEKKYVDGAAYYGDTTYLWRNMKILSIIVGCKFLYRVIILRKPREDFPRDLSLFLPLARSFVRSFVKHLFTHGSHLLSRVF
jgi:hypothetical protein